MIALSIVVPIYNEEDLLPLIVERFLQLRKRLCKTFNLDNNAIEILFVNDGSTDGSFETLKTFCLKTESFTCLNLSRNHGHQLAITAGIEHSSGRAVVIIDGDLQDPPEFIVNLYQKHLSGYDVVYAVRTVRNGEGVFKRLSAALFYRLINSLSRVSLPLNTGDFRIMSRRVVDQLILMREQHRYIRGMVSWIGFKQTGLFYDRDPRQEGESKFPLLKMLSFAMDAITSFSKFPLQLIASMGFVVSIAGLIYGLFALYQKFIMHDVIPGWTSLVILILILGGAQLFSLGLIGEYIAKIYEQSKNRPLFIVEGVYKANPSSRKELKSTSSS